MSSTLLLLRYDINAANQWINNKLNQLKTGNKETTQDVRKELHQKSDDIESIIGDSKSYFSHHRNHDPILKLSLEKLIKSWHVLTNTASHRTSTPVEPLNLSSINDDAESVSSRSSDSNTLYTPRFDSPRQSPDSARNRRYIPHLSPLYRAVIRAKVRQHGRRSAGSSNQSSVSSSPANSNPSSPNHGTIKTTDTELTVRNTVRIDTITRRRQPLEITLDPSDSEPEYEEFPWVNVSDDELNIDDIDYEQNTSASGESWKSPNAMEMDNEESKEKSDKPLAHDTSKNHSKHLITPNSQQNPSDKSAPLSRQLPQTTRPLGQTGLLRIGHPNSVTGPATKPHSDDLSGSAGSLDHSPSPPGSYVLYSSTNINKAGSTSNTSSLSVEIPLPKPQNKPAKPDAKKQGRQKLKSEAKPGNTGADEGQRLKRDVKKTSSPALKQTMIEDERDFPTDDESDTKSDLDFSPYENPKQDFSKTYRLDFTEVDGFDAPRSKKPLSVILQGENNNDGDQVGKSPNRHNRKAASFHHKDLSNKARSLAEPNKHTETHSPAQHSTGHNDSGFTDEMETPDCTPRCSQYNIVTHGLEECAAGSIDGNKGQLDQTHHDEEKIEQSTVRQRHAPTEKGSEIENVIASDHDSAVTLQKQRSAWWLRVILWTLLIFTVFLLLPFLFLLPNCCDNTYYHCGLYGFRRRHTAIPPH